MKFLVIGAGAIGSYIGGYLAHAGHAVTFIEKSSGAVILRSHGLKITSGAEIHQVQSMMVTGNLAEALAAGLYTAAILAVKTYDTAAVLEEIEPHRQGFPPLVSFQNGVESEERLAAVLGEKGVIAGTVTSSIGRPVAGEIVVERSRGLGIAGGQRLAEKLVDVFQKAMLPARHYQSPARMKWSKLLTNLPANASAAILDMTPAEILDHPGLFELEMIMLRETLAVMKSLRIKPVDLPGVPVRALALAATSLPLQAAQVLLKRALGAGRGGKMPSFYIDLHAGKGMSEVADLNGAVARIGSRQGVEAPVNGLLTAILLQLVHGEEDPAAYSRQPEKLLRLAGLLQQSK